MRLFFGVKSTCTIVATPAHGVQVGQLVCDHAEAREDQAAKNGGTIDAKGQIQDLSDGQRSRRRIRYVGHANILAPSRRHGYDHHSECETRCSRRVSGGCLPPPRAMPTPPRDWMRACCSRTCLRCSARGSVPIPRPRWTPHRPSPTAICCCAAPPVSRSPISPAGANSGRCELAVSPEVLVPRPETELLVERALVLGRRRARAWRIWARVPGRSRSRSRASVSQWHVIATDVSSAALAVARANAAALGLHTYRISRRATGTSRSAASASICC